MNLELKISSRLAYGKYAFVAAVLMYFFYAVRLGLCKGLRQRGRVLFGIATSLRKAPLFHPIAAG